MAQISPTVKRKVILSGALGQKFGRIHHFVISTPSEAIRALCANFRDFARELSQSHQDGVFYRVYVDRRRIDTPEEIDQEFSNPFSKSIRIVPVITGGKRGGLLGIVLGAAIIATAFFTGGASLAASGIVFSGLGAQVAFGIGVSLALGGVSQLLSPMPKSAGPQEAVENKPSYSFNGAVNTTAQGQCVPVGYGRLIVGSAVVSAGLTADEYAGDNLA